MSIKQSVYPLDVYGLPTTIERDGTLGGGDSAAIFGTIVTLEDPIVALAWSQKTGCYVYNGTPVRTPLNQLAGRTTRFSRDQLVPMACAAVRMGRQYHFDRIYSAHKDNSFLRAWNTEANGDVIKPHPGGADITGPQVWALWLRYTKVWWRHLVLWALDLENLIGSLIWAYNIKYDKGDRITRNHMLVAITANKYDPTFISKLSYKITPFKEMIDRWEAHCIAVQEYQTAGLFRKELKL